jgi:PilZ domain
MRQHTGVDDPKDPPPQWTKQRSVLRCPLVASVEVTDLHSGTRLSARISELSVGGCYVDAITPFPEGTLVKLRIIRDQGAFESNGKVVYTHANFGMGVAFTDVTTEQRSILEGWIAEIISKRA